MASGRPVTDETRKRVTALHAEGLGRNEIAKQLGIGAATVTKICKELDLTFDRSATAVAVEAHRVDIKARMMAFTESAMDDVERLHGQLFAPTEVINFGGRDNTLARVTLDEPPHRDKHEIVSAYTKAFGLVVKVQSLMDDHGVDTAKSMLAGLAEQMGLPDDV